MASHGLRSSANKDRSPQQGARLDAVAAWISNRSPKVTTTPRRSRSVPHRVTVSPFRRAAKIDGRTRPKAASCCFPRAI